MVSRIGLPEGEAASVRYGGRSLALAVLCVVLFLTFLDNTIVSVGLGSIQTDLRAGVSSLQWVVGAYALTFAGAMLGFGMVGDEFGRKRVMIIGIVIFCAGSVMSAVAPNPAVLIAGRAVMGFGAAASEPGTLSMLRHIYTDMRERSWAVGVWTAVSGVALAIGPVVGGALVGIWDWRAIFWFNLLVGAIALVLCAVVLAESSDPDAHRVDIAGSLFGAAAITALAFGVIMAEHDGFGSPAVIALLCVCAAGIVAFFWWQSRAPHPLLDLKFLRVPGFLTANVVAFCAYFATFAVFFFTALFLDEVTGASGYKIALIFLPMTVLMVVASVLAGRWTVAVGLGWSILVGSVLFAAGLVLTALSISPHPDYLPLAAALALCGIGIGSTVVPATSSALSSVPPERSGMAASTTNTSREIGAVAGVAVLGALVNARLHDDIVARMTALGIPKNFESVVINGVETGAVPSAGTPQQGKLVQEVISAAYSAFESGLHAALYLGAALALAAGLFTFAVLGTSRWRPEQEIDRPV
ncbi:MAG: MFS transporter [Actinobacteria bacterium]|nr:MFS transporter [Actinomycetota bacterium]